MSDCQQVSRALEAALDEADLLPSSYVLEVSSPGIDRPIRSEDDIRRNTGRQVVVTAADPEKGQRVYRGLLLGSDNGDLLLEMAENERVRIPIGGIVGARQERGL